jgi:hypothetical protein
VVAYVVRIGPRGDEVEGKLGGHGQGGRRGEGQEGHGDEEAEEVAAVRGGRETAQEVVGTSQIGDGLGSRR